MKVRCVWRDDDGTNDDAVRKRQRQRERRQRWWRPWVIALLVLMCVVKRSLFVS